MSLLLILFTIHSCFTLMALAKDVSVSVQLGPFPEPPELSPYLIQHKGGVLGTSQYHCMVDKGDHHTSPCSSSSSASPSNNINQLAFVRTSADEEAHHDQLIDFRTRYGGPSWGAADSDMNTMPVATAGPLLSFQQNESDFSVWNYNNNSKWGMITNQKERDTEQFGWFCNEANVAIEDHVTDPDDPTCVNKRPHMFLQIGENMQNVKRQCSISGAMSRKPKPKSNSAKDPQSLAAKNRRERISERLKILQDLVPNGSKVDLVTMLEKAISYVKFLQLQVKVLATDEFWPVQGGKAPDISQVKEAIDAILSSHSDRSSISK